MYKYFFGSAFAFQSQVFDLLEDAVATAVYHFETGAGYPDHIEDRDGKVVKTRDDLVEAYQNRYYEG